MKFFFKQEPDLELETSSPLMLIPGEYFFIEKILSVEEDITKDLDSFIEIQLEGSSPFSLDQLYWGYFYNQTEKSLFYYAMYIGRLTQEENDKILGNEFDHIYPSFIAGLGYQYSEPTINFVASDTSLSAFYWNNNSLPVLVESIAIKESPELSREELLANLNTNNYNVEAGYWKLEKKEILPDQSVRFENSYQAADAGKPNHVFILNGKTGETWNADIRPTEITKVKSKEQKTNRIVWLAILAVLAAFGILIVGEIFGLIGKIYLSGKESRFNTQAPKVKLIQDQENLAQKIEEIIKKKYTAFEMLELLNNSRPKKVYFTAITLGNENNVIIDGASATVDDLNQFTDNLNKSGLVEKFDASQIASRQGRVTFKLDVKLFPPNPEIKSESPETKTESVEETPKETPKEITEEAPKELPQEEIEEKTEVTTDEESDIE